jgi:hypothetical protein
MDIVPVKECNTPTGIVSPDAGAADVAAADGAILSTAVFDPQAEMIVMNAKQITIASMLPLFLKFIQSTPFRIFNYF